MRKAALTLAAVFLAATASPHTGHGQLAEASNLPGSVTYGLDTAMESISLALTFGKANRADKRLRIAEERLAEARELAARNRSKKAEKAVARYTRQMERVRQTRKELPDDRARELGEHINSSREVHTAVLESVMEKVPEQARKGIKTALEQGGPPVDIPVQKDRETRRQENHRESQGYSATSRAVPVE